MTPPKAKAKPKGEPTDYVVIEQVDVERDGNAIPAWIVVGALTGTGAEKRLIEKWAEGEKRTGEFKLVAARAWKGGLAVFEQTQITSKPLEVD